ncbi:MAG: methionine--tRNA ligase [Patescibacteria group bacterium]|nr:MAG: methionine--tRNA ligase [Patescibacteria group bacterium]
MLRFSGMSRLYITTTIPYVNGDPHIGHALEFVQADVLARYHRALGTETYFLTGTDDNAMKNAQAAEKEGLDVREFVDRNSEKFRKLGDVLHISFDQFIRTSEDRHREGVGAFWQAVEKNGDIYKKKYRGLYCGGCELFYSPEELNEKGECAEHPGRALEEVEEENYFFRLSKYQSWLEKLVESGQLALTPKVRRNEVLAFIKRELKDFSISRSARRTKGWGIPVPNDPSQTIYVWFDALINYITALGYPDQKSPLYQTFWEGKSPKLHVLGKGVSRFHAVYWPAMLQSAGLPLPSEEFIHGYLTVEGEKISKTAGNVVDPAAIAREYGPEPLRYYLLAKFSPFEDGDFSELRLKETYNADLANGLGNLVSRIAKLAEGEEVKNQGGSLNQENFKAYHRALKDFRFEEALRFIWVRLSKLDKYIDTQKPWKKSGKFLGKDLRHLVSEIRILADLLEPFLPKTAEKIKRQFRGKITPAPPLFPRLRF